MSGLAGGRLVGARQPALTLGWQGVKVF